MDYVTPRTIPDNGGVAGNIPPPGDTFPVRLSQVSRGNQLDPSFMYLMVFAMGFVVAMVLIIAIKTVNK